MGFGGSLEGGLEAFDNLNELIIETKNKVLFGKLVHLNCHKLQVCTSEHS